MRLRKSPPAVALAIISPILAELVCGNTPPLAFFHPAVLPWMLLFYGAGVVLVREFAFRCRLGWPGLLLTGAAFGVVAEALIAGTWFDVTSEAADIRWGTWHGVNWGIILPFCLYHAVFSVGVPIALVNRRFPNRVTTSWLRGRMLWALAAIWIAFSAAFLMVRIDGFGTPVTLGIGLALTGLALRSRRWPRLNRLRIRADISPRRCVMTGFASTAAIFIIGWWTRPEFLGAPVATNLAVLIAVLAAAGLTVSTTRNPARSNELNSLALLSGSVGYLALQGATVEIFGGLGMSLVGLTTIVLLVRSWRTNALRLGRSRSGTTEPEERQIQIVSVGG